MLIDIFDLNQKNQKSHDFFKKVMIFASPATLPQGYCNKVVCNMNRYQIHQTIGNESRFSLFIGQQSDECDIKNIGHDHEG